jgi:hypothetical protein
MEHMAQDDVQTFVLYNTNKGIQVRSFNKCRGVVQNQPPPLETDGHGLDVWVFL